MASLWVARWVDGWVASWVDQRVDRRAGPLDWLVYLWADLKVWMKAVTTADLTGFDV